MEVVNKYVVTKNQVDGAPNESDFSICEELINSLKVKLLKDKFGFDDAFNYKEETNLNSTLQRYFPDGIDVYFDNVGGEMLEAAIDNMNDFGRIAVCGVISEYTADKGKKGRPDMLKVVYKRIRMEGFLVSDFIHIYQDFISSTVQHLQA